MLVVFQVNELEVQLIVLGIAVVVFTVGACYDSCFFFVRRQTTRNWWD